MPGFLKQHEYQKTYDETVRTHNRMLRFKQIHAITEEDREKASQIAEHCRKILQLIPEGYRQRPWQK